MEIRAKITELATNYKAAVKIAVGNISKNYAADFQAFKTQVVAKLQARQTLTDADIALAQKLQTTSKAFQGDPLFEAVQAASAQVLAFCEKAAAQLQAKAVKVSQPEPEILADVPVMSARSKSIEPFNPQGFDQVYKLFKKHCASGELIKDPATFQEHKEQLTNRLQAEKERLHLIGGDESKTEEVQALVQKIAEHERILATLSPDACSDPDYYDIEVEDQELTKNGAIWTAKRRVRKIKKTAPKPPNIFFRKIYARELLGNSGALITPQVLKEGGKNNLISPKAKRSEGSATSDIEKALSGQKMNIWIDLRSLEWEIPPLPQPIEVFPEFERQKFEEADILNRSEIQADLQKIADELKKDPSLWIVLKGNTADPPSTSAADKVDIGGKNYVRQQRAETIKKILVNQFGANPSQITAQDGIHSNNVPKGRNVTATFHSHDRK